MCFEDFQIFEVKPLNIILGYNGAGKSALLKSISLFLKACIYDQPGFPSHTDSNVDLDFTDMIYGRSPHGSLGIGGVIEIDGEALDLWVEVQNLFSETPLTPVVSLFEVKINKKKFLRMEWCRDSTQTFSDEGKTTYDVIIHGKENNKSASVTFNGIWPIDSDSQKIREIIEGLLLKRKEVRSLYNSMVYFKALRPQLGPLIVKKGGKLKGINKNGEDALQFLADNRDKYFSLLKEWFANEEVGGWNLELRDNGQTVYLQVSRGGMTASIDNVGQGLSQVFPIVVQRCRFDYSGIEIVEEPESHLHAAAHGALADLFIEGVKRKNVLLIAETHSEIFLLRTRLRIAQGKIDHDDVSIYWVDSSEDVAYLERVKISNNGELDNDLDDVFLADYNEMLALRKVMTENGES